MPPKPPIPRIDPSVPPAPAHLGPKVSYTPIGVKRVSLTGLEVSMGALEDRVDDLEAKVATTASASALSKLEERVLELEDLRHSVVTLSEYPKVAKQHADTSAMEQLVKRRDAWRSFGRAVLQALLIAALLGLFTLAWSWWTGPKTPNPPVKDPTDDR
jgi:hypothetical protein